MSDVQTIPAPTGGKIEALQTAFDRAKRFSAERAADLALPAETIWKCVKDEIDFGQLTIDADGLSPGMRLHIIRPAQELFGRWRDARAPFVTALQPFLRDITALERHDEEVAALRKRRESIKEQIEERARADLAYHTKQRRAQDAKAHYETLRDREGRREPTMAAFSPWYWVALLSIGLAELLINYDTFLLFMGVPAIAAGASILIAALLAFAAHGHGTILKQWSERFGPHIHPRDRFANARFLGLATFSVFIVLTAAGGSRYGAVLHVIGNQPQVNILGAEAVVNISAFRDVSLSLLANVAAWAVGVFIAYLCHDRSQEYMEAKREHQQAEQAHIKARRPVGDEIATEEAKLEQEINSREREATVRNAAVATERDMAAEIQAHDQAIRVALVGAVRRNLEIYQASLAQGALEAKLPLCREGGSAITPFEYKTMKLVIDEPRFFEA